MNSWETALVIKGRVVPVVFYDGFGNCCVVAYVASAAAVRFAYDSVDDALMEIERGWQLDGFDELLQQFPLA